MSDNTLLYLSRADVESLSISMGDVIAAVEGALGEKGRGTAEMPPSPGFTLSRMPSFTPCQPSWARPEGLE